MDLFTAARPAYEPLASRMRPRNLDEFVGQDHILSPGRLLRRAIEADHLTSVLFYGPPGTGKTTLARVIAASTRGAFLSLNAVLSGVKEIREIIEEAKKEREGRGRKTILFVDEVHRWNKSQQDALLPWVENGTFLLVGATTENPFFEVNAALVSRSRVFQLVPLTDDDLSKIAVQALTDHDRGYGKFNVVLESGALDHLVHVAAGDARSLLNALELAVETSVRPFPPETGALIEVSLAAAEESIQKRVVLYDKDGDYHFDTISAFIKSIRGSDPDAALYWLAKMIRAGEDPRFLFRRMLISASEDVGLADPQALIVVQAASAAFDQIGLPEGQYPLAQAALYLATCPKSNSSLGYFEALKTVEQERPADVPTALKDASRDGKGFGHGQGYLYPHAFRDHWVAQRYLPSGFEGKVFYQPSEQGYEAKIRSEVLRRRERLLSLETLEEGENLTFTAEKLTPWLRRLRSGPERAEEKVLEVIQKALACRRHDRIWVASDLGLLVTGAASSWVPEGGVWTSLDTDEVYNDSTESPELMKPTIFRGGRRTPDPRWEEEGLTFERVVVWTRLRDKSDPVRDVAEWRRFLADQAVLVWIQPEPSQGQRLSSYLPDRLLTQQESDILRAAEEAFFLRLTLRKPFENPIALSERRTITREDWQRWWSPDRPEGLGAFLELSGLSRSLLTKIAACAPREEVDWTRTWSWQTGKSDLESEV